MRRLRKEQGMSAQKLSDRTGELGQTVSRTTVADIENGRRKYVTVAELLLLAAALNTTPVALVYPGPSNGDTEVLPHAELPEAQATEWFGGNLATPPPWADPHAYAKNRESIVAAYADSQRVLLEQLEEIKQFVKFQSRRHRWVPQTEEQRAFVKDATRHHPAGFTGAPADSGEDDGG